MESHKAIQQAYISELRKVQPELMAWWKKLAGIDNLQDSIPEEVSKRWPTGYSGHPRVLAIFRKYFFQIEQLNQEGPDFQNPVDLLILGINSIAPDLSKLVSGIVYVPVGLNQHDESV